MSVPDLPYAALDDRFRVGPFPSLLDVLSNDAGPRGEGTLELLDDQGRPTGRLTVPQVGTFSVESGYLRLDPAADLGGTATVRYRAASPRGGTSEGAATVLAGRAVSVLDDEATTGPGQSVTVAVSSNDALLRQGAYLVCGPRLSDARPPLPEVVVVVRPEPELPEPRPCSPAATLTTAAGSWSVTPQGGVTLSPAPGFRGTARAWYAQDADHPYDVGRAQVVVTVSAGPTEDGPGTAPGAGPTPATSSSPGTGPGAGDGGGQGGGQGGGEGGAPAVGAGPVARADRWLASTGAAAWPLATVAAGLLAAGAALVRVRRRPEAPGGRRRDGPVTHHR